LLALTILVYLVLVFPRLHLAFPLPFLARAGIALLLVAPLGLVLGVFLPAALERLRRQAPPLVPWAWGVNGILSVMAPIIAVGISTTWGINVLLVLSAAVYVVAGFSLPAESHAATAIARPSHAQPAR
jgi:hypothetical protein